MLDFSDLPYEFIPPKPNGFLIALARFANRRFALPGPNHRLAGVELTGGGAFREAREIRGARFVFLPNHPTHSDPQVMTEVCRRLRVTPSFMAAYDVFLRSKLNRWVMRRLGSFSVDREGSDRKSMACAGEILARGRYPLVIFPEGNVYLCNDRVTPFSDGAAFIALRAQRALGEATPVYAVPVSLKYTFVEDVRDPVREALSSIADTYGDTFDRGADVRDEIKRISTTALARHLKHRGHLPADTGAVADELIAHAAEQLITGLEQKIDLRPRPADDLTARIRKIRAAVHAVRGDPERTHDHRAAAAWADEAILALRVLGYTGGYTASDPTLDRVAETVARLREDVTSLCHRPDGRRRVLVHLGRPIDLREHLGPFATKARQAVSDLTRSCESVVQAGIDAINARNDAPGAAPF